MVVVVAIEHIIGVSSLASAASRCSVYLFDLVSLVELLLHAELKQHLLLGEILLLRHRLVLLLG